MTLNSVPFLGVDKQRLSSCSERLPEVHATENGRELAQARGPFAKHRTETAEMPIEFDLSFTDPETAPFRPRGAKNA